MTPAVEPVNGAGEVPPTVLLEEQPGGAAPASSEAEEKKAEAKRRRKEREDERKRKVEQRRQARERKAAEAEAAAAKPEAEAVEGRTDEHRERDANAAIRILVRVVGVFAFFFGWTTEKTSAEDAGDAASAMAAILHDAPRLDRAVRFMAAPLLIVELVVSKLHPRKPKDASK